MLNEQNLSHVRALNDIAKGRGQSLAQLALAWVLRDPRVTSALIGASSVAQLDDNLDALKNLDFSDDELARINQHAVESGIDLWRGPVHELIARARATSPQSRHMLDSDDPRPERS